MSEGSARCVVCLNAAHDHDADGVCARCQFIHRRTYDEVLALVSANDVHIETNAVLSTGDTHDTGHKEDQR